MGAWQDWPPTKTFREVFPDLYDAYISGLPLALQDAVAPNGCLNLAAYYPKNGVVPDLGQYHDSSVI